MARKGVTIYTPDTVTDQMIRTLALANCKLVRLELTGPQDSGTVNYLTSHGVDVIGLIPITIVPNTGPKDWQAPADSLRFKSFLQKFAKMCGVLAKAMPGVIVWEICNEEGSFGSIYRLTPQQYAPLYFQAHVAIRATSPVSQIIVGGLFAWAPKMYGGDTYANSGADYARQVAWIEEINSSPLQLDGVGVHLYLSPGGVLDVKTVHDYITDYSKVTNRPLYVTEFGWQSKVVSDEVQADNIIDMYDTLSGFPQVATACYFCLEDFVGTSWGLQVPGALGRKPAFAKFAEIG